MAAEGAPPTEPAAPPAEAPAAAAAGSGEGALVVTAANVRSVPLDAIPTTVGAWDPIALEVFVEVADVLFSRWGLLKFVMDEQVRRRRGGHGAQFPHPPPPPLHAPCTPVCRRRQGKRLKRSTNT